MWGVHPEQWKESFYHEDRNNSFQYTYVTRHGPNYKVSYKNTLILILTILRTSKPHKTRSCCWSTAKAGSPWPFHFVPPVDIWLHVSYFDFDFQDPPKTEWIKNTEISYCRLTHHFTSQWKCPSESRSNAFFLAIYRIKLVTWCTNSLTFNNCTLCPHCIYVFCIYLTT